MKKQKFNLEQIEKKIKILNDQSAKQVKGGVIGITDVSTS